MTLTGIGCAELVVGAVFGPGLPLPFCSAPAEAVPASVAATSAWTIALVFVAAIAAVIALFKDEVWHWVHAPRLDVQVDRRGGIGMYDLQLVLKNESRRMAAGVSRCASSMPRMRATSCRAKKAS